jgi:RNA polymerase sigma-70 factor, ECF subfamily
VLVTTVIPEHVTESAPAVAGARTALSFEAFFMANERRLFRALYVLTGDRDDAEDLSQLAFCRLWERWERVSALDDPVGYLFRSAFNAHHSTVRRAVRAARRRFEHPAVTPAPLPADVAADRDSVVRLLATLTPRQREALVLTGLLDLSVAEAARIMHIRPSTVRVLVSQARAAFEGVPPPDREPGA